MALVSLRMFEREFFLDRGGLLHNGKRNRGRLVEINTSAGDTSKGFARLQDGHCIQNALVCF